VSLEDAREFENIDKIRCEITAAAGKKCRKLCKGQVSFSPEVQIAHQQIKAWTLLKKRVSGEKVSSKLLSRYMKKASINFSAKNLSLAQVVQEPTQVTKDYRAIKKQHKDLQQTYVDSLATSLAEANKWQQSKVIKQLQERESQRSNARQIRYLQGKIKSGSTTMVTLQMDDGTTVDLTSKDEVEKAIIKNNTEKFQQAQNNPFYKFPLSYELSYKGTTSSTASVLAGVFESNHETDPTVTELLEHLKMPEEIYKLGKQNMDMSLPSYRKFWRKARENTGCYPDALSFATMKAGAQSELVSQIECALVIFPLKAGYSPIRWKQFLDVMIMKKLGATNLSGLRTYVLFPVDCNFAFKHVGRQIMRTAEKTKSIAKEQYGSRRSHRAIDLAVNKTLTFDIIRQLKHAGAICSNDAKSCYDLISHPQASLAMQCLAMALALLYGP